MKNLLKIALLPLLLCQQAFAQQDAKAKGILAEVSKKYRSYQSVQTDFIYNLNSPQANTNQSESGTLITSPKTNKFKVILYADNNRKQVSQELISDGKTQWTYLKADQEVQVSDADNSAEAMNPAQIFTMYEKGFKYLFTGEKKINNITYQEVELSPTDTSKPYFKVRLLIEKLKKQIYSAEIFDKNGNIYKYTVKKLTPNAPVADGTFSFNIKNYPGVELVDLR